MMLLTRFIESGCPMDEYMDEAAGIIKRGGLVAFPTETVYGLGGDAYNANASRAIYAAKGRPSDNPLIVHIAEVEDLKRVARDIPESAYLLAGEFWPGPLTMVLNKLPEVPLATTGGLDTVAVRLPNNEIARELIRRSETFIAAPSANLSGRPSPTKASHVREDLKGKIDMIIDGGDSVVGLESTIVDLTEEIPVILRPGFITPKDIAKVLGSCEIDNAIVSADKAPKAPGMKYRHYAPKGELVLVKGDAKNVAAYINSKADSTSYVICKTASIPQYKCYEDRIFDLGRDSYEAAKNLYDILRRADMCHAEHIYAEVFDESEVGFALMNRMLKAAGHRVAEV